MNYGLYQLEWPEPPQAVVFVNGLVARNWRGALWAWTNARRIGQETRQAEGCFQVKSGLCSAKEVVMVSYWRDEASLTQFFRGSFHREMMQFVTTYPEALCLYNETYRPHQSGKYMHEPQGLAVLYPARGEARSPTSPTSHAILAQAFR